MTQLMASQKKRGRGRTSLSLKIIAAAYEFLRAQPNSVRGVCYHLLTRPERLIKTMEKKWTDKVGGLLTAARVEGMIPWEWIVDEQRDLERSSVWPDMDGYLRAVGNYRRDPWPSQPHRVEVWSEKGTVRTFLQAVLDEYAVGFRVMHGNASWTVMRTVHELHGAQGDPPLVVLYVGDLDPSGLYMSQVDIPARLAALDQHVTTMSQFEAIVDAFKDDPEHAAWEHGTRKVTIRRVAIIQSDLLSLPTLPLPVKKKGKQKGNTLRPWFVEQLGGREIFCELDAMDPRALSERVEQEIVNLIVDKDAWQAVLDEQPGEQKWLAKLPAMWKRARPK